MNNDNKNNKELEGIINRLKVMRDRLYEDLQAERRIVMQHNIYGRKYEESLRKYDEFAIRYDQIKKVFDLLEIEADVD